MTSNAPRDKNIDATGSFDQKVVEATDLTTRTSKMVGRKDEVERLKKCLNARGECHFLYYWAVGGLGKTRLLEELQRLVTEAKPGFYSSGIIDLYHTDTHSTSDIERTIVEGLDPNRKFFKHYRQERKQFELLRERGSDPGVLEKSRAALSQLFVQDCRDMAHDARKLVICFDTVELLQYESSVVEEKAGLDTVDTRLKPWLLQNLAQLANVLVVFAGRPKRPILEEEVVDHHMQLIADMRNAFGHDFKDIELKPFDLPETKDFLKALSPKIDVIPIQYLPIVHLLTEGRPIFLHLVVDLIQRLSPEPRTVLEMFGQYTSLVEVPEDSEQLKEARRQIRIQILRGVFSEREETDLGGYLSRLALMPKGFDAEVLEQVLGVPAPEAKRLLQRLEHLSFVKRPIPPAIEPLGEPKQEFGTDRLRLFSTRLFFHDEMYQLLTLPGVMPNLRVNERQIARALVTNYYDPQIEELKREISPSDEEERIKLRERVQKLQVERLYYLLVQDQCAGYEDYKRLSDEANRRRWVGFNMRLLDEFLRLYNNPTRRKLFEAACIPYEQVVRESAQMWVERFYWWGQYEKVMDFAHLIVDQPAIFYIDPYADTGSLATICARWVDVRAMRRGYELEIVQMAEEIFHQLPSLAEATPEQTLARARLGAAIGYQYRLAGRLDKAAERYVEAKAAFDKAAEGKLPGYPLDEQATLLHSLAYVYARQGRMLLARPLGNDGLRLNQAIGNEYTTGLTLSTLAAISMIRGSYSQAETYAKEALTLLRRTGDPHGTALSYLHLVRARRKLAKLDLNKNWKPEETYQKLQDIDQDLKAAIEVASEAVLSSDLQRLQAERGRLYRDLGEAATRFESREKGLSYYRQGEQILKQILTQSGWATSDKADALQDLAEILFLSGDPVATQECLREVESLIGPEYLIVPGQYMPTKELAQEYFLPLGKVEMTRGQMAFDQGQFLKGLQHFVLAYVYFMYFSSEAMELDTMVEYLYNHLRDVPNKRGLIEEVDQWAVDLGLEEEVKSFMQILEDLLGV